MYRIKVGTEQKNNLYGWADTAEEANKIIHEYIKKQEKDGFKSYYTKFSIKLSFLYSFYFIKRCLYYSQNYLNIVLSL